MENLFKQYMERFILTKADYKNLLALDLGQSSALQVAIAETYDTNGEIAVKKYLKNTHELDELMADHTAVKGMKTAILNEPYHLKIFIPEYPPRLKEYKKTKFSPSLAYTTKLRWHHYMSCALRDLKAKGAPKFEEKVMAIINYYYDGERYDVDNYAIKFINDALKYSDFITDDRHTCLSFLANGNLSMDIKGTEITLVTCKNFIENPTAFI